MRKIMYLSALVAVCLGLSGCAPLVIGGAGVLVADKVAEDQNGGDGLF